VRIVTGFINGIEIGVGFRMVWYEQFQYSGDLVTDAAKVGEDPDWAKYVFYFLLESFGVVWCCFFVPALFPASVGDRRG
jgi:hypothetical protein